MLIMVVILFLTAGCKQETQEVIQMGNLKLTSPGFENNAEIPSKYTCDGQDVNPGLVIENIPQEAESLALIVDDPDAPIGTWVHWVVWNIALVSEINEDTVPGEQGINDFKKQAYGGPCPPSGIHRYFFKLYALDTKLELSSSATKKDLEDAMKGHIIEQTQLVGTYSKK